LSGSSFKHTYDDNGNRIRYTDRNGRPNTYTYDALGQMTKETWYQADGVTPKTIWKYGFDAVGNLTSSTGGVSTTTFTYDALNRQIYSAANLGVVGVVAFDSQYDTNGNRTLLKATIAGTGDFQNDYRYDELNRLIDVKQWNPTSGNAVAVKQVGFNYNDANQLTRLNRFNHGVDHPENIFTLDPVSGALSQSYYAYDNAGQLRSIAHDRKASGSSAQEILQSWTYDSLHQVKTYVNSSDSGTSIYNYDGSGQLTTATGPVNGSYSYDQNGNRTSVGSTAPHGNRLDSDNDYNYFYDAEGNLIKRIDRFNSNEYDFSYDNRDRLTTILESFGGNVTQPLIKIEYNYDGFDRLIGRRETDYIYPDGAEGTSPHITSSQEFEQRVYDGDHVVLDFLWSSSTGIATLEHRYLYGPAVDQVLAQENVSTNLTVPGSVLWMLADNQGTVHDLVNNSGQLQAHYHYDAFGQINESLLLTRYLYTGRDYDVRTKLQYNRERWYDANSGRWLTQDPIGFAGGDSNLYRYVGNSPTNGTDPIGLAEISLGNDITARIDGRGSPFGGFEIHVKRSGEEIAKINGAGGWAESHGGGKPLMTPSTFKNRFPDAYKSLKSICITEARSAFNNGLRRSPLLTRDGAQPIGILGLLGALTEFSGTYRRAQDSGLSFSDQWDLESLEIKAWITGGKLSPEERENARLRFGYDPSGT
jgi:RHS repeat-associated protein